MLFTLNNNKEERKNNLNHEKNIKNKKVIYKKNIENKIQIYCKDINNNLNKEENKNNKENQIENKKENSYEQNYFINNDYINNTNINILFRENNKLIKIYGEDLYKCAKEYEIKDKYEVKILVNLNPEIRTRMINWMMEVFYIFNSEQTTFFLAVNIFNKYLNLTKKTIYNTDIHLIGIVCIYISSKMEDIFPIKMRHIIKNIGHNKFTRKQIMKNELLILRDINYNIINISTYDFLEIMINDLKINNKKIIKKLKINKHLNALENICLFLAKLITLNEEFIKYDFCLNAICCIICGFDILRSNSKTLENEMEKFLKDWILFIINECDYKSDEISNVYRILINDYKNIERMKKEKNNDQNYFNLCKYHQFIFY